MNETKPKNPKLRNALLRALAALVIGIILFVITNFSVFDLIRGPSETVTILDEEQGAYVKHDIMAILGFYDSELKDGELQPGNYALVPMGGKLLTVHFTNRYRESADTIMNNTYKFFNGTLNQLDNYLVVEGTVSTLTEKESGKMYEWFNTNKDSLVKAGIMADTNDASTYLDDVVLNVDTVNGKNQVLVIVLTAIAALCFIYIIVILLLMGTGHYLDKPEIVDEIKENDDKVISTNNEAVNSTLIDNSKTGNQKFSDQGDEEQKEIKDTISKGDKDKSKTEENK